MTPEARLIGTLTDDARVVPLVTGGCGTGRTGLLRRLQDHFGDTQAQYVDLERVATTPEQFLRSLIAHSPFTTATGELPPAPASPRVAYDEVLRFLASARTRDGAPASFLLDEVLELRTFESFPGLRAAMTDFLRAVDDSPNRFVLTSRFARRAAKLAADGTARVRPWALAHLSLDALAALLRDGYRGIASADGPGELAVTVHALTDGRPACVHAVLDAMKAMAAEGACDPISALSAVLVPGSRLDTYCRFSYEIRLHHARGHGALRAILAFLAEEQPLTLTDIARRMQRTPGSTKDYLTWLEDVDLLCSERKRYRFADPILRVWVRLNGRPAPPREEDVAREVHRHALERLPATSPQVTPPASPAPVTAPSARPARDERRDSGIIEID